MAGTFNKHHSAKFMALGLTITYKKAKRAEAVRNQSIKISFTFYFMFSLCKGIPLAKCSLPFSTIHCFINYVSQIRLLVSIGCMFKLGLHIYPNIQKK
ncbi:hypothetical protein E1A91_D09G157400v1 [Gossypium mustelinum]|uniref:Uncharacterized protein n=1 Tax=Gossypium mustelinum TaxID=34275 RepID=A0A5D2TJY5_GOSMU|nr:hypothetical protein E1A91_D09G157000v1 [Gossypium mustelinum]TYI65427.1 hypothetical protein E1A91_D09G157400v1 [Gossypium mustelinum]